MADFRLVVGVNPDLSYPEMKAGIDEAVLKINNNPPKIKVELDTIDDTALKNIETRIKEIGKSLKGFGTNSGTKGATSGLSGIATAAKKVKTGLEETEKKANKVKAALKEMSSANSSITSSYNSLKDIMGKDGTKDAQNDLASMKQQYIDLFAAVNDLSTRKEFVTQEDISRVHQMQSAMQTLLDQMNSKYNVEPKITVDSPEYIDSMAKVEESLKRVTEAQTKWTKAKHGKSKEEYKYLDVYRKKLVELKDELISGSITKSEFNKRLNEINKSFGRSSSVIKQAGEATKSLTDRFKGLAAKFASWLSVSSIIMALYRALKKMFTAVRDIDTAMTELKKVTNESDATYNRFLNNATKRAQKLGSTVADTVSATADFARLGYGVEDAEKLADAALVYKNVGDGIEDVGEASESIIATLQAFSDEVAPEDVMLIVDKFNEVGNNFAISSKGVGDILLRSAAAMKAAGNSLDETIALGAAANTVVQDPEKVGTTLKTVSMFLRAAKTEAEDAGESTDGMAASVSELRNEILALTGNRVDIQIDDDTFKSTYQILKDLSGVWDDLTDVSKANILEMVGGKRNSNVVAALLENFEVAEKVVSTSAGSAGSAMAENEKFLDSINGKIQQMQAAFQTLSASFINSEWVKTGTEIVTWLLNALTALNKINLLLPLIIESMFMIAAIKKTISNINAANDPVSDAYRIITAKKLEIDVTKLSADAIRNKSAAEKEEIATQIIAKMTTEGKSDADIAAALAALNLTAANKGLASSFKSLLASIPVWGWISLAISVVLDVVIGLTSAIGSTTDKIAELDSELESISSEIESISSEFKTLKTNADSVIPRFAELAKGVDKFGRKVDLTDEEYSEFLSLNNQIAEMFPELNMGMDENGNYMLALAYNSDTLTESLYAQLEAQRLLAAEEIGDKMPDYFEKASKQVSAFEDQIKKQEAILDGLDEFEKTVSDDSIYSTANGYMRGDAYEALKALLGDKKTLELLEKYTTLDYPYYTNISGKKLLPWTELVDDMDWGSLIQDETYKSAITGIGNSIELLERQIEAAWAKVNPSVSGWLETNFTYSELGGEDIQSIVKSMVGELNWNDLGITTAEKAQNYITDNILTPIYSAGPQIQEAIDDLNSGKINKTEFKAKMNELFTGVLDGMDDETKDKFGSAFASALNTLGIYDGKYVAGGITDLFGALIDSYIKTADKAEEATTKTKDFAEAMSDLEKTASGLDMLDKIYADVLDGESFDYSSILNNADFTTKFGNLDSFEKFRNTILNFPSDISKCQGAFNDLISEFISSSGALNDLTEESKAAAVAFLEQHGVTNALSIVEKQIEFNTTKNRIATELETAANEESVREKYSSVTATKLEQAAIAQLTIEKIKNSQTSIDSSDDIENILKLAQTARLATADVNRLTQAKQAYLRAEGFEKRRENLLKELEKSGKMDSHELQHVTSMRDAALKEAESLSKGELKFDPVTIDEIEIDYKGGSSSNSVRNAAKDAAKDTESWFEKEYNKYNHMLSMDALDTETYLKWLNNAYQKAYKEGIIELDDYYKYREEVYDGLKELHENYISDLEHQVFLMESNNLPKDQIIAKHKEIQASLHEEANRARSLGLDENSEYIQGLQKQWWDHEEEINSIEEDVTENAKDAFEELIDFRIEMIEQEIESERDALDERLDALKEFYDKQKDMLQDQHDEEEYLNEQAEKRKSVADIRAELARLEFDDSAWAQKRKLELQEELTEAEKDLTEFEDDHALDLALDALDKEYERQEKEIQAEMDALDDLLNDPEALYNQALNEIKNSTSGLYQEMLEYNRKHGDGNDETVKEMWENAYSANEEYKDVYGTGYNGNVISNETGYTSNKGTYSPEVITKPSLLSDSSNSSNSTDSSSGSSTSSASSTAPSLTKGSYVNVKANTKWYADSNGGGASGTAMSGKILYINENGSHPYNIDGNGWVRKEDIVGYATGTKYATPGLHSIFEKGDEYIFTSPSDGTRYRMFSGGEKVLNADATDFLYDFANSRGKVLAEMIRRFSGSSGLGRITGLNAISEVKMGDIIIQGNADKQTVSEIRRAQRENITDFLKELNKLNK